MTRSITRLFGRLRRFSRDRHGVAAVEFALIVPILMLLALGCFEVPRFVLVFQQMSRTAAGIADLVAQADEPMTLNQMNDIFTAGDIMMSPFDVKTKGEIIVSSINNVNGGGVTITWQQRQGSVNTASKLGAAGGAPSGALPAGLSPGSNEEVLAAEVYFNYTPVLGTVIYTGSQFYMAAYSRPRNHNLMTNP